ncbi:MAG: hypothetical protein K8H74_13700, partial [Notoacmeibacter sp.]|nr:hypothetical protein [Notoacmeibacter sp.]
REDIAEGRRIKAHFEQRLSKAVRDGADPVWVVPHPDDVVITDEGWIINGPIDEEGLKPIREQIALRDLLLLQSVLDERLALRKGNDRRETPYAEEPGSTSIVLAHFLNGILPTRFRLSETEVILATMRHERLTRRELLKATRQAWRSVGRPMGRGWTLPPWSEFGARLDRLMRTLRDVFDQMKSGAIKGERQIAERLEERLRR